MLSESKTTSKILSYVYFSEINAETSYSNAYYLSIIFRI